MKNVFIVLIAFTAFVACNNTNQSTDNSVEQNVTQQTMSDDSKSESTKDESPSNVMLGTWIGEMSGKKLTIMIESIDGITLTGYNILGSNKRSLKGTFTDGDWDQPCTKAYETILNEPGDDVNDGIFSIKFVGYEDEEETDMGPECKGNLKGVEAYGEWTPNKSKTVKEFSLEKEQ